MKNSEHKYVSREFWEKVLASPFPCLFMMLYKELNLMKKDETLRSLYLLFVKDKIFELSKKLGNKMLFVDWLSAYGNSLLSMVYNLEPNHIYELLNTEDKASKLKDQIKRSFDCETIAIDICDSVLEYGKNQLIFDKTYKLEINSIFDDRQAYEICKYYMNNGNLMYLGSVCYMKDNIILQLIDWFSEGKEEGYLFLSFAFPLDDVDRNSMIKKALLSKLEFVGSLPGQHREFLHNEGDYLDKYKTTISFQETWCIKRKLTN